MKKIIVIVTLIALILTFAACNNKKNNNDSETPTSAPTSTPAETPEENKNNTTAVSAAQAKEMVAKANKYLQDNPYFICRLELDSSASGMSIKQTMTSEVSGKNAKCESNLGDTVKLVQTIADGMYYASSESAGNAKIKYSIDDETAKSEIKNMFSQIEIVIMYMEDITSDYTLVTNDDGSCKLYCSLNQKEDNVEAALSTYIEFDKDGRYISVSYESASSNSTTNETTKVSSKTVFEYKDADFKISAPADASEYIESTSRR